MMERKSKYLFFVLFVFFHSCSSLSENDEDFQKYLFEFVEIKNNFLHYNGGNHGVSNELSETFFSFRQNAIKLTEIDRRILPAEEFVLFSGDLARVRILNDTFGLEDILVPYKLTDEDLTFFIDDFTNDTTIQFNKDEKTFVFCIISLQFSKTNSNNTNTEYSEIIQNHCLNMDESHFISKIREEFDLTSSDTIAVQVANLIYLTSS